MKGRKGGKERGDRKEKWKKLHLHIFLAKCKILLDSSSFPPQELTGHLSTQILSSGCTAQQERKKSPAMTGQVLGALMRETQKTQGTEGGPQIQGSSWIPKL